MISRKRNLDIMNEDSENIENPFNMAASSHVDVPEIPQADMDSLEKSYKVTDLTDISRCFAKLHASFGIELETLKTNVSTIRKRVNVVEDSVESLSQEVTEIQEEDLPKLRAEIVRERNERIKLDLWGRKWNLVVKGIDGNSNETVKETDKVVRASFVEKLKIPQEKADAMLFQSVHRLPGGPVAKKNIHVRFLQLDDRDLILDAARKLSRGCGFSAIPDLPPVLAQLRYDLSTKLNNLPSEEKAKTKLVYLREAPFILLKPK